MERSEWLQKALDHISTMKPGDLFEKIHKYSLEDWEKYCRGGFEVDILKAQELLNGKTEVELYDDNTWHPPRMFLDYVCDEGTYGFDEEYWGGYGAEYYDLDKYNLRLYIINGQGTVHILTHIEV